MIGEAFPSLSLHELSAHAFNATVIKSVEFEERTKTWESTCVFVVGTEKRFLYPKRLLKDGSHSFSPIIKVPADEKRCFGGHHKFDAMTEANHLFYAVSLKEPEMHAKNV